MNTSDPQPAYRWVVVTAAALILAVSMGAIVNGMSAFIIPMQENFGWSRGDTTLINFAGILGLAFGGLVMGPQADRRGTRPVVLFGVIVLGLCYVLASVLTSLWQFYLLFFIAGFFGAGAIFPPVMAAVGNWFFVGAGMAIGIASAGQALGQGAVPFVSSMLIASLGIKGAFAAIGAFMLATMIPLSFLLRQPPALSAAQTNTRNATPQAELPTNVVILYLSAAIILCCTCMAVPLMHLVPLIQDRGFAPEQAGSVIFVMLIVAILGRLAFGKLADIIGALPAYMTATAWMTLMVFGFTYVERLSTFYVYAVIYGFGYAGVMTGVLVSIRVLVSPAHRASAFGIVTMFGWFGHAIGGYQGGALYDLTGNYTASYAVAALAGVLNLVIVSNLLRKQRRLAYQPACRNR
ncbi:MFS transporter [Pseudorhodobacter turbinis]|uniref:MFS transporter n=1 Tax=Pseudorhodobacter turbinis TaxID=2500533 RepID=A0A4P8ECH7_9RHOB|nr:MFS transporter [Pseudorhodobacter turbinis]QCO54398.1 MFS transporter [Pseudorhodobacter turbinis]